MAHAQQRQVLEDLVAERSRADHQDPRRGQTLLVPPTDEAEPGEPVFVVVGLIAGPLIRITSLNVVVLPRHPEPAALIPAVSLSRLFEHRYRLRIAATTSMITIAALNESSDAADDQAEPGPASAEKMWVLVFNVRKAITPVMIAPMPKRSPTKGKRENNPR